MYIPKSYSEFKHYWQANAQTLIQDYTSGNTHFIANLLPNDAIDFPSRGIIYILEQRFGDSIRQAFNPNFTQPSPVIHHTDGAWLRHTNMVGINVRTIGSFWNIIKYALTLPKSINSVHILPIWEPGVVASLYGITSFNLNTEFYSPELAEVMPHLNTVEKQLKVVINILHAMGRSVGLDVIPHTDRYSEICLANPHFFEWLQRHDFTITDHSENLHLKVQATILNWLNGVGSQTGEQYPNDLSIFFSEVFPEERRIRVMFGNIQDAQTRNQRRNLLIQRLYNEGFEPVPATMGPPYRGLAVSRDEAAQTIDDDGRIWRDYVITKPQAMSRVFGPLARYKLYECLDNNKNWEIDFNKPRYEVWDYVCKIYDGIQKTYNFDFMRGDMSHVQMQPNGVPGQTDQFYDIHKGIKQYIRQSKPYFGYFAESFLVPPNTMAFGDENDHLEASNADATLGDLQSMTVGSKEFLQNFSYYDSLLRNRNFAPNFTVMTADKDDPRFDEFYLKGNELRQFMAYFLTDMPSYVGLGFETRDIHTQPAPNEYYTKLYVFQLKEGKNATTSPYKWGLNGTLFRTLTRLKIFADQALEIIQQAKIQWIIPPTDTQTLLAWTQAHNPRYVFVVNLDLETPQNLPKLQGSEPELMVFSTITQPTNQTLAPAEARAYRL